jgi:hypothetical protein
MRRDSPTILRDAIDAGEDIVPKLGDMTEDDVLTDRRTQPVQFEVGILFNYRAAFCPIQVRHFVQFEHGESANNEPSHDIV